MSSTQTRIILICVVLLVVGGAGVYGIYRTSTGGPVQGTRLAGRPELPGPHGREGADEEKPFAQYRAIADRGIFKPLVAEPSAAEGLEVPANVPPPTGRTAASSPPPKPDPFANLAMTGVIERGRVRALITDTSTGRARYVAKGEQAFGARVLDIGAKKVKVEKAGQIKELRLGENLPKETPERKSAGAERPSGGASERRGPGGRPGMSPEEMRARFGGPGGREALIRRMRERARARGFMSGC